MNPADLIQLTVAGTPRSRPRPRGRAMYSKKQGRYISVAYQPKKIAYGKDGKPTKDSLAWARANAWYEAVRWALHPWRPAQPWSGPVRIDVDVYFERPKRLLGKKAHDGPIRHTAKPDRDNLDKAILDALAEAGLFAVGDEQVCAGELRKWYAARGCAPGVVIVAQRIGLTEDGLTDGPAASRTEAAC